MARGGTGGLGAARRYTNSFRRSPDGADYDVLRNPLPRDLYGQLIVEANTRAGEPSYLSVYDPIVPAFRNTPPSTIVRRASDFLAQVAETSRALDGRETLDGPFPEERNRTKVSVHLRRERKRALADHVKARDGYRCQVCSLLFEEQYGDIGKGFAEAHHVVPLAQLRANTRIIPEDLITVCANCHRMLHRMRGVRSDWRSLRKQVRRNAARTA